jgi:hypothetical protein
MGIRCYAAARRRRRELDTAQIAALATRSSPTNNAAACSIALLSNKPGALAADTTRWGCADASDEVRPVERTSKW